MSDIKSVGELKLYFERSWTYLQTGYNKYCMNMTISFQSSSYLEPWHINFYKSVLLQ